MTCEERVAELEELVERQGRQINCLEKRLMAVETKPVTPLPKKEVRVRSLGGS